MKTRFLVVQSDAESVAAYLPSNYHILATTRGCTLVAGEDSAGWDLDGYVIPRLSTGLYPSQEVLPSDVAEVLDRLGTP